MEPTQDKAPGTRVAAQRIIVRIATILACSIVIGWYLNHTTTVAGQPAGFVQGALHGALMPCQLPRLLVGYDVVIYAPHNTGRTYKLGYTVGVNGCGTIFFGLLFWRVNRWRKRTIPVPVTVGPVN
jgi:hypothetical protein